MLVAGWSIIELFYGISNKNWKKTKNQNKHFFSITQVNIPLMTLCLHFLLTQVEFLNREYLLLFQMKSIKQKKKKRNKYGIRIYSSINKFCENIFHFLYITFLSNNWNSNFIWNLYTNTETLMVFSFLPLFCALYLEKKMHFCVCFLKMFCPLKGWYVLF